MLVVGGRKLRIDDIYFHDDRRKLVAEEICVPNENFAPGLLSPFAFVSAALS
jgi:hypothetical protein